MAQDLPKLYDGQANADKRLAVAATGTAYDALTPPPDSVSIGGGNTVDVWLSNTVAAQGGKLCIMESSVDPATGDTVVFLHERTIPAADLTFKPSDAAWGLAVGDTFNKNPIRIPITGKSAIFTIYLSASDGGVWYARYHAHSVSTAIDPPTADGQAAIAESVAANVEVMEKTFRITVAASATIQSLMGEAFNADLTSIQLIPDDSAESLHMNHTGASTALTAKVPASGVHIAIDKTTADLLTIFFDGSTKATVVTYIKRS